MKGKGTGRGWDRESGPPGGRIYWETTVVVTHPSVGTGKKREVT